MSDSKERYSDFLDRSPKEEYERKPEKKLRDFILGILLNVAIFIAGYIVFVWFFIPFLKSFSFSLYIPLFLPLIAAVFYFVRGRKYFGLGVIVGYTVLLLLALLVFGACMMMISSA